MDHFNNIVSRLKINKFVFMETGTYSPYYQRPWETHFNPSAVETIVEKVSDMDKIGVAKLEPELFSGIASSFIHPSTNPQKMVMLPNGWDQKRLRFLLEVEIVSGLGIGTIFYFQGYTDHLGIGNSGSIDPEMLFVLNSFIKVNRHNYSTSYGIEVRDVVTESAQIINGIIYNDVSIGGQTFKMRPYDVYAGIRRNYITQHQDDEVETFDTTVVLYPRESLKSSRSNNLASKYLVNIIDSYRHANSDLDGLGGGQDMYERCSNRTNQESITKNEFIRCLSNMSGRANQTVFRYGDLLQIDNNIKNVTKYIVLSAAAKSKLVRSGDSAEWKSRDNETVMASLLLNSISSLMVENYLISVHLTATNYDGDVRVIVLGYNSFVNADMSRYIGRFIDAVEKQVLFDMTYGNQISFELEMMSDLLDNTSINLSLDGAPSVLYNASSFCDSLLTPIIGSDKNTYYTLTNDVEHLINSIGSDGMYSGSLGNGNSTTGFSI